MKKLPLQGRTLALLAVVVPLLLLFIYVGLRSGPLAPVAVTVVEVQSRAITPALFGIGTVQARYTYKIGPTVAGRVKRLEVQVGDQVKAGQVLGEMEPVDLDDRVRSQDAAYKRSQAALTEAQAYVVAISSGMELEPCAHTNPCVGRSRATRMLPTCALGRCNIRLHRCAGRRKSLQHAHLLPAKVRRYGRSQPRAVLHL